MDTWKSRLLATLPAVLALLSGCVLALDANAQARRLDPGISRAGSYDLELGLPAIGTPDVPLGGFVATPGQNLIRKLAYIWPRGTWSNHKYVAYPDWLQPWKDYSTDDRTRADYRPAFDFNAPNENFYDKIRQILDTASDSGVVVILVIGQGSDYGGDAWTYNPFNPANNINGVDAGSYYRLVTAPDEISKTIYKNYIAQLIDRFGDRDNLYLEVENEGWIASSRWQEELVQFIHGYARSKALAVPVMRSSFADVRNSRFPLDPADPLHYSNTEADAVSVALPSEPSTRGFAGGSCLKNSSRYANVWHYPVPVYFDTDHNCPGQILTPAQIDTLYYLGYYILQLGIGNPASEAALAHVAMSRQ